MIEGIKELREICQKDKLKTNRGLTLQNRKISIYFTWLLLHTPITANQVTLLSIFLGIVSSLLFTLNDSYINLLGVLILYLSLIFDQVDGEIARYKKNTSINGVYLDELRHLIIYSFPVFSLSFSAFNDTKYQVVFILGFLSAFSLILQRIDERLPKIIYIDKWVYKDKPKTSFPNLDKSIDITSNKSNSKSLFKKLIDFVYFIFDIYTNQVSIIICFLTVSLLDIILPKITIKYQTLFFFSYSLIVPIIVIRTIYSKIKENLIERDCIEIERFINEKNK